MVKKITNKSAKAPIVEGTYLLRKVTEMTPFPRERIVQKNTTQAQIQKVERRIKNGQR